MKDSRIRMTFKGVLVTSYVVILVIMLIIGIISVFYIRESYLNGSKIYTNNLKVIEILEGIDQNIKETDQYIFSMMTELDSENHKEYLGQVNRLVADTESLLREYKNTPVTEMESERFLRYSYDIAGYNRLVGEIIEKIEKDDITLALDIYEKELKPVRLCIYESIESAIDLSEISANSRNDMNRSAYVQMSVIVLVFMLVMIIATILIVIVVTRYINKRLTKIKKWAGNISEYDVSDDIESDANDEFSETYQALNTSQFMVRELIEKIVSETGTICETGEDVSLAINKSNERLENINQKLYEVTEKSPESRSLIERLQKEINDITMYLEQVAITSDYQIEVAKRHKEQVTKFKTKGENTKSKEIVSGETGVLKRM
ncbi:MAG: methyl-accepting chemotaxis protein [Lachnospiraceae bacterium]|nr:methyl-accepting chemotaxis protein [Lachnospiraceae bacterium]